ncbi:MAG: glycosyltransferase family 2 protein [Anaerolineae bacterium]|nr:glycosyltransferase family 2 protein [Anaerolineae bacterium]
MLLPSVTVILPIRNEAAYIERCLDAILAQNYTGEIEIIVVDGMSIDDTRKRVGQITQHSAFSIRLLDNPGKIVPTGINIALRQARSEIIIRVDGHTLIAPDYIYQCVESLQCSAADNVGGRMNAVGKTLFGKVVALATSTPFGVGGGRFHYSEKEELVDTVYMGAWPRRVFEQIGLFDEELVRDQDDEFNYRIRAAGGKILLSPAIKSEYTVRSTPRALWRQYFQYGFWKIRVLQKHPRQMSIRQFVPPLFVLALLFSFALFLLSISRLAPAHWHLILDTWYLIPVLYLLANLVASILTIYRAQKTTQSPFTIYHLLLPLIFAILHISYGLGFLLGLFKFWNRWGDKSGQTRFLKP